VHSLRSAVFAALGAAVLTAISGCGDDSGVPETSKTSSAAKSEPAAAPKSSGFPALPNGAGIIDPDAPEEFTETDSGLKYRILRKSDGRKPNVDDGVLAHYKGWLDSGKQFDSSYDRGEPSGFPLRGVIKGWTEGLQLIGEGAMIELDIPGDLAYPQGRPGIPPGARLHFIVELKKVR
jgi:FKBP-type peptidyl-prolyl cis-trans isomerase FkpA